MKTIPANTNKVLDAGYISKLTQKVPDFTLRNRNRILFGGLAVLLFSIWNIPNIVIDSNYVTLFKSVKYGLLSIIPSVLPIVLAGSFAGWLGISLDQSAVLVFAMTMGIAVDDAIHVMSRYLLAKSEGGSTKQSIARAMNESGRAVVFSSIVLVFGFSVLCFASFTTIIYIGLFGSIIMTLALVGDLVMLPAILYWADGSDDGDDAKLTPAS